MIDGGLCIGLGWVKLVPGEVAKVDHGPDFDVFRVRGPGKAEWGTYSGSAARVSADVSRPLLKKDGVTIYRAASNGFEGYFAEENGQEISSQNHFFGNVFKDASTDATFFRRVTFGVAAKAKCEGRPK